jgi:hypothetical protein
MENYHELGTGKELEVVMIYLKGIILTPVSTDIGNILEQDSRGLFDCDYRYSGVCL